MALSISYNPHVLIVLTLWDIWHWGLASNVFGSKRFIKNMQIFCRILFTLLVTVHDLDYKEKQFLG